MSICYLQRGYEKFYDVPFFVLPVGHLPDPSKCKGYLDTLVQLLDEDRLRESLLKAINTALSCGEVVKAKVSSKNGNLIGGETRWPLLEWWS